MVRRPTLSPTSPVVPTDFARLWPGSQYRPRINVTRTCTPVSEIRRLHQGCRKSLIILPNVSVITKLISTPVSVGDLQPPGVAVPPQRRWARSEKSARVPNSRSYSVVVLSLIRYNRLVVFGALSSHFFRLPLCVGSASFHALISTKPTFIRLVPFAKQFCL